MKPINMKTWEVQAILDNRKTVMRRVVKPQPHYEIHVGKDRWSCDWVWWGDKDTHDIKAPYCLGDILYVRETWCPFDSDHVINGVKYAYKADEAPESERTRKDFGYKWHPSIHMPREAARIFLRVTDVRVERLWNMTNNDLVNDFGLTMDKIVMVGWEGLGREVWDSTLNPKDRALYSWEANPYVWCVSFEKISKEDAYS